MARLPVLYNLMDDIDRKFDSFYDDNFGLGVLPQYLRRIRRHNPLLSNTDILSLAQHLDELRMLSDYAFHGNDGHRLSAGGGGGGGNHNQPICQIGKDGFQACMDVSQFKPNELNVKVVGNSILVEGKHEERQDPHGSISRHFMRRYTLPKGYDPNSVVSTLSSDGVLTVAAPKPQLENKQEERMISIQQTGPAHLNVKENAQEKVGDSNAERETKVKK